MRIALSNLSIAVRTGLLCIVLILTYISLLFFAVVPAFWIKEVRLTELNGTLFVNYKLIWGSYDDILTTVELPNQEHSREFDQISIDSESLEKFGIALHRPRTFNTTMGSVTVESHGDAYSVSGVFHEVDSLPAKYYFKWSD